MDVPNECITLILWRGRDSLFRHKPADSSDAGNFAPGGGGCYAVWQDADGDGISGCRIWNFEAGDTSYNSKPVLGDLMVNLWDLHLVA